MNLGMITKSLMQGNRNDQSPFRGIDHSVCITRLIAHCPLLLFYRAGAAGVAAVGPKARKLGKPGSPSIH
jgi:hypothetical protein